MSGHTQEPLPSRASNGGSGWKSWAARVSGLSTPTARSPLDAKEMADTGTHTANPGVRCTRCTWASRGQRRSPAWRPLPLRLASWEVSLPLRRKQPRVSPCAPPEHLLYLFRLTVSEHLPRSPPADKDSYAWTEPASGTPFAPGTTSHPGCSRQAYPALCTRWLWQVSARKPVVDSRAASHGLGVPRCRR